MRAQLGEQGFKATADGRRADGPGFPGQPNATVLAGVSDAYALGQGGGGPRQGTLRLRWQIAADQGERPRWRDAGPLQRCQLREQPGTDARSEGWNARGCPKTPFPPAGTRPG